MKKLISLLLILCLLLGITACSEKENTPETDNLNADAPIEGIITSDDSDENGEAEEDADSNGDALETEAFSDEEAVTNAEPPPEPIADTPAVTTAARAAAERAVSDDGESTASRVMSGADSGDSIGFAGDADYADDGFSLPATPPPSPDSFMPVEPPIYELTDEEYIPDYTIQAGQITAGEWNDNRNWDFWRGLIQQGGAFFHIAEHWKLHAGERTVIRVIDENGNPVRGAEAVVTNTGFRAVTDHNGIAYLFRQMGSHPDNNSPTTISVTANGVTETVYDDGDVVIAGAKSPAKKLDLMFMVDTTGSMGDELSYLQAEMENAISTVSRNNSQLPIRLSVNFYRDVGDEYLVRPFPFTTDISKAISDLRLQRADGGGDTPEAVEQALENAINQHDWEEDSIKIMFIVLDAPPHHNNTTVQAMPRLMREAAAKGIRAVPVVSSAGCKETEFLMRNLAIITGGTYTFTTGHSGIGFGHVEPTIGDYEVEKLNSLIIRIINEYLQ